MIHGLVKHDVVEDGSGREGGGVGSEWHGAGDGRDS